MVHTEGAVKAWDSHIAVPVRMRVEAAVEVQCAMDAFGSPFHVLPAEVLQTSSSRFVSTVLARARDYALAFPFLYFCQCQAAPPYLSWGGPRATLRLGF